VERIKGRLGRSQDDEGLRHRRRGYLADGGCEGGACGRGRRLPETEPHLILADFFRHEAKRRQDEAGVGCRPPGGGKKISRLLMRFLDVVRRSRGGFVGPNLTSFVRAGPRSRI
jgi:hypothetical protein